MKSTFHLHPPKPTQKKIPTKKKEEKTTIVLSEGDGSSKHKHQLLSLLGPLKPRLAGPL